MGIRERLGAALRFERPAGSVLGSIGSPGLVCGCVQPACVPGCPAVLVQAVQGCMGVSAAPAALPQAEPAAVPAGSLLLPPCSAILFPLPLVILEGMKIIQLPDLLYSGWDGGQKSLGQKGWRGEACRNGCAVPSCSPRGAQCQAGVCRPCSLLVLQVVMVSMETSRTFPAPYDNGQAMSKAGG